MAAKPTRNEPEKAVDASVPERIKCHTGVPAMWEGKDLYEDIVRNMNDGVVLTDIKGIVTFVNPALGALLGYRPEELVGKPWLDLLPPDQQPIAHAADKRRASGHRDSYELALQRRDGARVSVLVRGNPRFDAQRGQFVGTLGILTDITERKRAEEDLSKANERMEMLLYSLPEGILVIEQETHRIIDANPRACAMIGLPAHEIIGRVCHEFVCPAQAGKCPVTDFGKSIETSERVLLASDGLEVPILKTVLSCDLEGKRCLIECFSDMSEIKHAELDRLEKEKLQAVIETAGAVCHEVNQPLMAMLGYSELLQKEAAENDHLLNLTRRLQAQVQRVEAITQKLMKITSHKRKKYLDSNILDIDGASENHG